MNEITTVRPSEHFPFSSAAIHNGVVYVSGQVGFKPGTTELVSDDLAEQARQTFANIDAILEAAGSSKSKIIRCGVYLRRIQQDFGTFNAAYAEWLGAHRPARTAIEAEFALPGILVEVDCVAALG